MMKVFTSVFVLEGRHAAFEDIDEAVRRQVERAEVVEVTDPIRRQVASLEMWMGTPRSRTRGEAA